jgi:hypothetical protein
MKYILIVIGIVVLAAGAYFGSFFIRDTEVNEAAPEIISFNSNNITNTQTESQPITKTGTFGEVDRIHKGSGTAKLIDINGTKTLRFEDFQVTNGPDLYVYLTKNPTPTSSTDSLGEFINLGRLKGNVGNQNYEITQDISGYDTVVIWCQQFSQLFSYANLK